MADFTRDEWDDKQPGYREDVREYPDAIDDEAQHRPEAIGQPGADDVDLWEPTDDPDYWGPDGVRAYRGNETALRWRIVPRPGLKVAGLGFESRSDAVAFLGGLQEITPDTFRKFMALNAAVAGWAKITADGWTIQPEK